MNKEPRQALLEVLYQRTALQGGKNALVFGEHPSQHGPSFEKL